MWRDAVVGGMENMSISPINMPKLIMKIRYNYATLHFISMSMFKNKFDG